MFRFTLSLILLASTAAWAISAEEKPAGPAPAPLPAETSTLELFTDPKGAYSLRIPAGFRRLTEDENRDFFKSLSEYMGKDVHDRVLRQPPVWFRGPDDPKKPNAPPPTVGISYTDMRQQIDPSAIEKYRADLEESYRKRGIRAGDVDLKIIKVGNSDALRVEHDIISPIDNTRNRVVMISVPGGERRYDIYFNFSRDQSDLIAPAINTVLATFTISDTPRIDPETRSKWTRVIAWTAGGLLAGILISILLRILAGVGQTEPEESGG